MTGTTDRISAMYRRFAAHEARGRSELYEQVSEMIADDRAMIGFLAALPVPKRQPNLLLATVQYLFGVPSGPRGFRTLVLEHRDEVSAVMLERATQTNQPARCATLLPALAELDGPLALLEVGASAGLCLLPDRYDYVFVDGPDTPADLRRGPTTVDRSETAGPPAPRFTCRTNPATPRPTGPVEVAWRAGLDLHPLDVADADDRAWLNALVWPGEEHLRTDLNLALDVARGDPPPVYEGDLRTDLPAVVEQAPPDATLVVFHTAVLAYLPEEADRDRFAVEIEALRRTRPLVWLANETPARIPGVAPGVIEHHPAGEFLLCADARPLARTDPHGAAVTWVR